MAHAGGNGKTIRLKPQDRILALKELPMQRRKPAHSHTQRLGRGGLGGPWHGRDMEKTAFPIMDCEFMHVRRITVDASGCLSWCLACSFNIVGAQVYPGGGMPGSVQSAFYVYLMNTFGAFIISI